MIQAVKEDPWGVLLLVIQLVGCLVLIVAAVVPRLQGATCERWTQSVAIISSVPYTLYTCAEWLTPTPVLP